MHALLDLKGRIPGFIQVSNAKLHDVHALDLLEVEAGAIYVMDRGYVDFACLHSLHLAGTFELYELRSPRRTLSAASEHFIAMLEAQLRTTPALPAPSETT
jgi:hypothetical protein